MRTCYLIIILLFISNYFLIAQEKNTLNPIVWVKASEFQIEKDTFKNEVVPVPSNRSICNFNCVISLTGKENLSGIQVTKNSLPIINTFSVFYLKNPSTNQVLWTLNTPKEGTLMFNSEQLYDEGDLSEKTKKEIGLPIISTLSKYQSELHTYKMPSLHIGTTDYSKGSLPSFEGKFCEFLLFDKRLKEKERQAVESYLAIKYAIHLPSANYINSELEPIWNKRDKRYNTRITGIGRDDSFYLYQKQSTDSETSIISIGVEKIETWNDDNKGEIENLSFLVWADNNKPLTWSNDKISILNRSWKIDATKNASNLRNQVKIDLNQLNISKNIIPILMINRKGKDSFESDEIEEYEGIISDNYVVFNNIQFDTDRSGNDVFTVAAKEIVKQALTVDIYPNPSERQINIQLVLDNSNPTIADLKITDVEGKIIYITSIGFDKINSIQYEFEFAGEYFIELNTAGERYIEKVVIIQ